jgi:hypothetical protein
VSPLPVRPTGCDALPPSVPLTTTRTHAYTPGAVEFGEPKPSGHGTDFFFERAVASRVTWGRYVRHFYLVTGRCVHVRPI